MDQSKSNDVNFKVELPKRSFSLELLVGIFTMVCVACAGYLAVGLGDLEIGGSNKYDIYAEFDNISGLKKGASVEIAGVQVGTVSEITLKPPSEQIPVATMAVVTLHLDRGVQIQNDDTAMIRTKGIIGDRYVKISRGSSKKFVKEGEMIKETESVVDLEELIGKLIHGSTEKTESE